MSAEPLLAVRGLTIDYPGRGHARRAVRDLDFDLAAGEAVGLLGPSGSGKSSVAAALVGLLPPPGRVTGGSIRFAGQAIGRGQSPAARRLRGRQIGLVFQDSSTALNPVRSLGSQAIEAIRSQERVGRRQARGRAGEELTRLGLEVETLEAYPHELSGGQRQRALMMLALVLGPRLLVLDEPTAALDPPLRRLVLQSLDERRRQGMAILLVTHDWRSAAALCDRLLVLDGGRMVDAGSAAEVLARLRQDLAAPRAPEPGP